MSTLISSLPVKNSTKCHPKCLCVRDIMDCSRRGLVKFPPVSESIKRLTLDGNNFGSITKDSLPYLPNIIQLSLKNCGITALSGGSFKHLPNLETLNLSNNLIAKLGEKTFEGLRLKTLQLGGNSLLTEVESLAFSGSNVTELYMSNCGLKMIGNKAFVTINGSLSTLDLSGNHEISLSRDLLSDLTLRTLHLERCELSQFPLVTSSSVSQLYLDDNPLGRHGLTVIQNTKGLTHISLQNTDMEYFQLSGAVKTLKWINMSRNRVQWIPGSVFKSLPALDTLIWRQNQVRGLAFNFWQNVPNLSYLDLSHNRVANIAELHLGQIKGKVNWLHLAMNQIRTIPEFFKESISKVKRLYLDENPIHCNCKMLWFYKYVQENPLLASTECMTPVQGAISGLSESIFKCNPPSITSLSSQAVNIDSKILVECIAEGDPSPTIQLQQKGEGGIKSVVSSSSQSRTNSMSSLVDTKSCNEVGWYECIASNSEGKVNASIMIEPAAGVRCGTEPTSKMDVTQVLAKTENAVTKDLLITEDDVTKIHVVTGNDVTQAHAATENHVTATNAVTEKDVTNAHAVTENDVTYGPTYAVIEAVTPVFDGTEPDVRLTKKPIVTQTQKAGLETKTASVTEDPVVTSDVTGTLQYLKQGQSTAGNEISNKNDRKQTEKQEEVKRNTTIKENLKSSTLKDKAGLIPKLSLKTENTTDSYDMNNINVTLEDENFTEISRIPTDATEVHPVTSSPRNGNLSSDTETFTGTLQDAKQTLPLKVEEGSTTIWTILKSSTQSSEFKSYSTSPADAASGGLSSGQLVGVIIGSILGLIILLIIIIICVHYCKSARDQYRQRRVTPNTPHHIGWNPKNDPPGAVQASRSRAG